MKKFAVLMMLPLLSMMMCSGRDVDPYAAVQKWYGDYDVKFYRLNIEASDTSANVKGCAEIVAGIVTDSLQQFTLELAARAEVYSVWVNGSVATFKRDGDLLHAIPAGTLAAGTLCSVRICYAVSESEDGGFFTAVSNSRVSEWDMPVTWTLSEPFNAKYWFPCKQYLPDKADSAYIFVTVPEHLKAGAPGVLSNVVRVPEGRMRYEWKTQYPVAYYLLSFAVADYADYTVYAYPKMDSTGKTARVSVHNYVYNRDEYISGNRKMMDTIASLIELYSELYIPYPFAREKYGHCVAPMGGGMEHQTMTTLSEFNFLLMAHELAHQWFGNLVTCASFQDVWINEGFASYSEYLALERLASPERAREWLEDTHAGATWSQNSGSVFVPAAHADDEWRIFDMSLSYKKGAALVHSIRRMVNDDSRFFDILRGFLRKYSFSVATGNDFRQYLESETGMDFTAFFDQWYFGEGFPIFDLSWKNGDGYTDILVEQHGSSQVTPMFTVDLDVRISGTDGSDTIVQIPIRSIRNTFRFTASREASGMEIDPYYNVLKQVRNSMQVRDFPTDDTFVQCSPIVKRQEDLHVTLSAAAERNCSIKLTDAGGENVFVSVKAGRKQTVTVPMADLEYGIYLLYVKNGSNQYVRKIFKTPY